MDRYGTHASFSTRRWYATVSAPGVDVVIADPDDRYYEGWGTSAASAFVSGAVALVKAAHPGLSPAQIKRLLEDTARNVPSGGRDDSRGYGFVDPAAAIKAMRPDRAGKRSHVGRVRPQVLRHRPRRPRRRRRSGRMGGPLAGALGLVLLTAAVFLWRGRRDTNPFQQP